MPVTDASQENRLRYDSLRLTVPEHSECSELIRRALQDLAANAGDLTVERPK